MDDRNKHITYGQAVNLAADTYDIDAFETDAEFIQTVLLRADVFYAELIKRQAALGSTPPPVATAQRAIQAAATSMDFDTPFGEEPPMPSSPPPMVVDSNALPEIQNTGLGFHKAEYWAATDRRCPACGMATLVQNLADKGPRYECGSRNRGKNPNTGEWQTISACDYTAWG